MAPLPPRASRLAWLPAACACLALGLWLAWTVPQDAAMGWDESMHAELPAARIALGLRAGEPGAAVDAVLGASQYPFVWPLVLGALQLVLGVSEAACRAAGSLAWALTVFVLFATTRAAVGRLGERAPRAGSVAPWAAAAFAALSPLAGSFSGTLFLEVPAALACALALRAWLAREGSRGRELAAGAWIAVALFTKWNYGLLLGAALAADWLCEAVGAFRRGEIGPLLRRTRWLVLPPAVAALWWFVLPLPGGFDVAAEHRASFLGYLGGNLGAAPAPAALRVLYAATGVAPSVRLVAVEVGLALLALGLALRPPVRALALAALLLLGAPLVHPFFLDRLLIPGLVPLFALAGLGLARALPAAPVARAAVVGALAVATLLLPGRDGPWLAARLGQLAPPGPTREFQVGVLFERARLGAGRRLPTSGLARDEHEALLDLVASAVRPGERVGWIGASSELSPGALYLGLLRRGHPAEDFLRWAHLPLDVTYFGVDPALDDAALRAFAAQFDVILWTEPPDLRERADRAFTARYHERLLALEPLRVASVGTLALSRPLRPPLAVTLFACRRQE